MTSPEISHDFLKTQDRNLKSDPLHLPDAAVDNAAQLYTPVPPVPSAVMPSVGESNEPVSHKRKRQPYNQQRKSEVAAVRRVGACKDCQQKKIRCPHALKLQPANGSTTPGTMSRPQNSTLQDFPLPPRLCSTSRVRSSDALLLMPRISPTSFKRANRFSSQELEQLDRHTDHQNRSQMYMKHSAVHSALTRQISEATPALERVDQNLDPFRQRTVDSQTTSYLRTRGYEQTSGSPTSMPTFLGEDEPRDQMFGQEMKQPSHHRHYGTLQSSETYSNTNLRRLAPPQSSPADYEFLVTSSPFNGHRYHDIPDQISEVTSTNSQTEIPSLFRPNLPFAKSHSNSLGTNIAPGEFYYDSIAPEGLEALPPGSFDTSMLDNVANATEPMLLRSPSSPFSTAQHVRGEVSQDCDQRGPLNSAYRDNSIFGANFTPAAHSDTPRGYMMPLLPRNIAGATPMGPHYVVSSPRVPPSERNSDDPNNFTISGDSADPGVGNSNFTYGRSHNLPYYDFPSSDFDLSKSLQSHPAARHNYPPGQIQPHDERMFDSSRPNLAPPNSKPGILPSVPQQ